MKNFFRGFLIAALVLCSLSAPAFAAPLPYLNTPFDTPLAATNTLITNINGAFPANAYTVACTGTTTATCQGLRLNISTTGLTTAAGVTAATVTVTDTLVTAVSQIFCQPVGYAGTGNPIDVNVVPAAGSFTFNVQNTHASAALNATVVSTCFVYN